MFGHMEFRQPDTAPRETWAARITAHLDSLDRPVTRVDLRLLETAAQGRAAVTHGNRMRVCALLSGARDAHGQVTIAGQAELLRQVRVRAYA